MSERLDEIKHAFLRRPTLPGWLYPYDVKQEIQWLINKVDEFEAESEHIADLLRGISNRDEIIRQLKAEIEGLQEISDSKKRKAIIKRLVDYANSLDW